MRGGARNALAEPLVGNALGGVRSIARQQKQTESQKSKCKSQNWNPFSAILTFGFCVLHYLPPPTSRLLGLPSVAAERCARAFRGIASVRSGRFAIHGALIDEFETELFVELLGGRVPLHGLHLHQ